MKLFTIACLLMSFVASVQSATSAWSTYEKKDRQWYVSPNARQVAENILSWQSDLGSWPKNLDTTKEPFAADRKSLKGTFDNGATVGEVRFLARIFTITKDSRFHDSFLKGLDHILAAQYATGGWPQAYPPGKGYARHITFNDDTMVHLLELVRDIGNKKDFSFIDDKRREASQESFRRGIDCILKCQVIVNGKRTVWCAQHDEIDFSPRPARSFELVSLSGAESARILRLLMTLENPGPGVVEAIESGVKWFESAKLTGIRQIKVDGDKRIISDPNALPLWARFYEIETTRPFFSGRDGIKKYDISQIEAERRNGYAWYGSWGEEVSKAYHAWKARADSGLKSNVQ